MRITVTVNGRPRRVDVFGLERLLDVLRGQLELTGTKEGCGEGECGACSVMLNGRLVNSCLVPAAQLDGGEVTTVEAVGSGLLEDLHPVQQAMMESGGAQCGICTPGMIMAGYDYVQRALAGEVPVDDAAIRRAIAGNLCRCTGYVKIVDAIAAATMKALDSGLAPQAPREPR